MTHPFHNLFHSRSLLTRYLLVLVLFTWLPLAGAQPFPSRPIRIVVPAVPGSTPDIVARLIAPELSKVLGQAVVIDDRPGAGSIIAVRAVATAPADGYTLYLTVTSTSSILPFVAGGNLGFDPAKWFAPISRVATAPLVLWVNNDVPAKSVRELIELAKARPKQLHFGAGVTSVPHLAGFAFMAAAGGIELTFVPYKNVGSALPDVAAGVIQVVVESYAALLPYMQAGKVRPLVIASNARIPQLPGVPSAVEAGVPEFEVISYFGLLAPKGTPANVISALNAATRKVLDDKEVRERLIRLGLEPSGTTPDEFAAFIANEQRRWEPVVKASGVKLE